MNTITIYHNPQCGTSRNVLAHIRAKGIEPVVIEYLKTPLSRIELVALLQKMTVPAHDVLRSKEAVYEALNLSDQLSDDALIDAMVAHPILMNRPIVVGDFGVHLCRPSEAVLALLATLPR